MSVATFSKTGTKATTAAKLSKDVFAVEVKSHDLMNQAYNTYLANGREVTATTKKRGEVRGGGKKPWRQKGTGRARAGSTRSPIWRGGGITFGPSGDENYTKTLPTKTKHAALKQALSVSASNNQVSVIDAVEVKDAKTKTLAELVKKMGLERRILIVDENPSQELRRASQNLPNVEVVAASYLNVFIILNADNIVFTKTGLSAVEAWLGGKK